MRKDADALTPAASTHRSSCFALLLACALALQSCASSSTLTNLVPGKELSRSSLGFKETSRKITIKEINPYTVQIVRNICETELVAIEYQGLLETRHGTQTYDCSDAYINYVAHNITALGVPLLYDSVTGFSLLKDKCKKNQLNYRVETAETSETVSQEDYNPKSTICRDTPIVGELIRAKIKDEVIEMTTSDHGIASLPPETFKEIEQAEAESPIRFQYNADTLSTVYVPPSLAKAKLAKNAVMNSALGGNLAEQANEAQSMALLDQESAMKKSSAASAAEPESAPPENRLASELNAVPAPEKAAKSEAEMMAKLDQESAMKKPGAQAVKTDEPSLPVNKLSRDVNRVANPATAKLPESDAMAKVDTENAALKKEKPAAADSSAEPAAGKNKLAAASNAVSDPPIVADLQLAEKPEAAKPKLIIRFASNKAAVKTEFRDDLEKIAAELRANPVLMTMLSGHTDNIGSAEVNLKMSLRRAAVIKDLLIKSYGVPAERIQIKAYGLTQPLADNSTAAGRALNRRTEISIISQPSGI